MSKFGTIKNVLTARGTREILSDSQFTDDLGDRNITVTVRQQIKSLSEVESKIDNARRVVLNALDSKGYGCKVRAELSMVVPADKGYIMFYRVKSKVWG